MYFKVFVDPPPELPVYDGTVPFLILVAVVAVIMIVNWLRRRSNS